MAKQGLLLIISGPSGVGKTTITHEVERRLGAVFSVSVTTRAPAAGDVDGQDYYFIDRTQFETMRAAGDLLEWAEVFGNCYGTPRKPVEQAIAAGQVMILEIDVQGAIQIKKLIPQTLAIFVLPPSEEVLLQRLRRRQREDEATIQRRFAKAKDEIALAKTCRAYDHFIVNDKLDAAVDEAITLVQNARR